jgi:endonuclease YncB( thermonuclease family)
VLLLLACGCFAQQAAVKGSKVVRLRGSVLAVEDSDRIKIVGDDGISFSAVLLAVDAPDEKQDFFKKAKKRLAELVEGKDVTVLMRTDERGETFAVVYAGADDVGLKLIREGFAWFSPNRSGSLNASDREIYTRTEAAARTARSGLWDDKNPTAPWAFRGEKVEPAILETTSTEASAGNPTEIQKRSSPVPGRKYILGPRGGCYYLNDQGVKVYVKDKTLCQNP